MKTLFHVMIFLITDFKQPTIRTGILSEQSGLLGAGFNDKCERNMIQLYHGDCLKLMFDLPDNSVDMVCCDMPFGTTACKWDTVLPLDMLWCHYKRVVKENGAIVLNASQPFTSSLIMSNPKMFRHEWVWDKVKPSNFLNAKIEPLRQHESILVFGKKKTIYNPQMTDGKLRNKQPDRKTYDDSAYGEIKKGRKNINSKMYPKTIVKVSNASQKGKVHPTQKPLELIEYLIKTYTNKDDTVLDNCMGSGTTGVACKNLNRNFIGIELDNKYFQIAKERIESVQEFEMA